MEERKLVKIASDNPAHPKGYYIQFADRVKPGDVEYKEVEAVKEEPAELTKQKRKRK